MFWERFAREKPRLARRLEAVEVGEAGWDGSVRDSRDI